MADPSRSGFVTGGSTRRAASLDALPADVIATRNNTLKENRHSEEVARGSKDGRENSV